MVVGFVESGAYEGKELKILLNLRSLGSHLDTGAEAGHHAPVFSNTII